MCAAKVADVSGPMSSPSPDAPNGGLLDGIGGRDDVLGVGRERRSHDDVGGQHDLDAALGGLGEIALDGLDLVGFEQARAHLVALRGEEGEEHSAADQQAVDTREAGAR